MKKLISIVSVLLFVLVGCNQNVDWNISVEKEPVFKKDKATPFAIKVMGNGQPITGLQATALFSMVKMDHGTAEAELSEKGDGIYVGNVELSMAGEWEVAINLSNSNDEVEEIIVIDVKKDDVVAKINDIIIDEQDIEFYKFINELHIEIYKETDAKKYTGKELEDAHTYWEKQKVVVLNQSTLLTQIIRLQSMALLSKEKGHIASSEEVNTEIEKARNQYGKSDIGIELIKQYGEEKFWNKQQEQYELIVLVDKVQQDVLAKVKEENPEANQKELQYIAQKKYEELLVSQVNSLEIDVAGSGS